MTGNPKPGQPAPKFRKVGSLRQLRQPGRAILFDIDAEQFVNGFVICFNGRVLAYRNQCPHTGVQMDWVMGEFFDEDGQYLICATHGAMFDPEDGKCVNGPCVNQRLISIPVKLEGDAIYVLF